VVAGLLCLWAGTAPGLAEGGKTAPLILESIVFQPGPDGGVVRVQVSGPPPSFSCKLPGPEERELTIELPGTTTQLPQNVDLGNPLAPEATVTSMDSGASGLRLRLKLSQGVLSGFQQEGRALLLHLSRPAGSGPDDYRVGVGDKLEIGVFGHDDLSKTAQVRADGTINYPLIGDLSVVGKTVGEVDDELTRLLAKDYLVDPQVSVEVREYQSQWVTVMGEVHSPGKYFLKHNMRLIDVLAEAGGVTKDAGTQIIVTRQNGNDPPQQIVVDRNRILNQTSREFNFFMQHGDIIAISEKEVFYIRGEVIRPGPYLLETGMTILKAITIGGGFTQFANRKQVDVLRSSTQGVQKKIRVNMKDIEEGRKEDFPLQPNDTIIVPRRIF
jgi:polysaccharide export outer membrane protein